MDFDEFVRALATEFQTGELRITGESGLWDDLGLDSLDAVRMIVWVEAVSGASFPPVDLPELYTVSDVYKYYKSLRTGPE